MKLNQDCVRAVLLYIENNFEDVHDSENSWMIKIEGYSDDDINYSCLKLYEAGFINGNPQPNITKATFIFVFGITWRGHQFLDNIRSDEPWKKTKSIIGAIGSVSLAIISETASKVIMGLIDKELAKNGLL